MLPVGIPEDIFAFAADQMPVSKSSRAVRHTGRSRRELILQPLRELLVAVWFDEQFEASSWNACGIQCIK